VCTICLLFSFSLIWPRKSGTRIRRSLIGRVSRRLGSLFDVIKSDELNDQLSILSIYTNNEYSDSSSTISDDGNSNFSEFILFDNETTFPCSTLSDEELWLIFNHDAVLLYDTHRLVIKKNGKMISFAKSSSCSHLMASIDICPRRLIDTHAFRLVEFEENSIIPPYAILSHLWIGGQEVVHSEFIQPRRETFKKLGYWKLRAACQRARQDGICYIWVDTCCIEQGNHEDVAANITSMYAFYQNAAVCYTHLADVTVKSDIFNEIGPLGRRRGSEWFYRGWTLQELLAPRTVIFFNYKWDRIGDKHELRDHIHHKTAIPPALLSGEQSIQDIDVLTRMSWTTWRETTKPQDRAYCLQGLLGVSVVPDYDEEWWTSFNRLGKALFEAQPGLKEKLGIDDSLFDDPDDDSFYALLHRRFWAALREK